MQAIVTKYLGPTDYRGSRIKATADAGTITVPYDYALSNEALHRVAADALVEKLGWGYLASEFYLVAGGLATGGYAFVFAPKDHES